MIKSLRSLVIILFVFVNSFASAQSFSDERDFWIDKYLSVSYPLSSISVTSPYGMRYHPVLRREKFHSGVDLKANYQDTYAMFDGTVKAAGADSANGRYVVLRCGRFTITYCHLSQIAVRRGQLVMAGDVVGVTGSSGLSTGPHLHLTCKKDGRPIDPEVLFAFVRETQEMSCEYLRQIGGDFDIPEIIRSRKDFFNTYARQAIREQLKYGIPASVTLAQMALESGWGKSNLARNANNYFGIRATQQWIRNGNPYYLLMEQGGAKPYCMYDSPSESIEAHSRVLMGDKYRRCRLYDDRDYHGWLVNIKRAGYAAAPDYVSKCERIIRQNRLYLYDDCV